ncbi:transcription repressor NadR [uncultured Dialister sp.]|uniref:transcription repressor NadR n=1 Tax=uncultured Dialister sp. TaxID=278064 RepID=UPI0025CCD13E|nr:transcription repressor NadR [uncultured Dialister sp.]
MNAKERREKIREILNKSEGKVKGNDLADLFQVSRQIVVGDVALLKASGLPVISTPRGYYVEKGKSSHAERTLVCIHQKRQTAKELEIIVAHGGIIHNVSIDHEMYGIITAALEIENEEDIRFFLEKMRETHFTLLSSISGGIHSHLIEAENEEKLDEIEKALRDAGFLYEGK